MIFFFPFNETSNKTSSWKCGRNIKNSKKSYSNDCLYLTPLEKNYSNLEVLVNFNRMQWVFSAFVCGSVMF